MSVPAGTVTPTARPVASADREKPNQAQTRLQERQYEITVPVLMDRCHQQRVRHALEPEREARFEPRSYGFRPGRSCQDAIAAICNLCKGPVATRVWALDADLAAGPRWSRPSSANHASFNALLIAPRPAETVMVARNSLRSGWWHD
jgi:hypothetical protein